MAEGGYEQLRRHVVRQLDAHQNNENEQREDFKFAQLDHKYMRDEGPVVGGGLSLRNIT
jgi:hypothetical protein